MVSVWEKSSEIKPFFCLLLLRLLRTWGAGTRLHPYDLNKQCALAQVTGAVEGGEDSWLFPWGSCRCQYEALGALVSITKPCWLLPDSDSQAKGEQESGFILWGCTPWPSGFLDCACMGLTLSRHMLYHISSWVTSRWFSENALRHISAFVCLTTGTALVHKLELSSAGKPPMPTENLWTEEWCADYDG